MGTSANTVARPAQAIPGRSGSRVRNSLYPIAALFLIIVLCEFLVNLFAIRSYLLPAPSVVVQKFVSQASLVLRYSLVTGYEIILGFAASVALGIPLSIAIYYSKFLERVIYPILVSSQTIPKIAVAPLLVIWFGWGLAPKVIVAMTIAIFPIVINTMVGLKGTPQEMIYLVQSMGASRLQTFLKISMPNALPSIFGGLKVAITLAVVGAVVGEFVAADSGLGYLLLVANGYLDTALAFVSISALSILGIFFFLLLEVLERIVVPWRAEQSGETAQGTM